VRFFHILKEFARSLVERPRSVIVGPRVLKVGEVANDPDLAIPIIRSATKRPGLLISIMSLLQASTLPFDSSQGRQKPGFPPLVTTLLVKLPGFRVRGQGLLIVLGFFLEVTEL
jgi:hypothetical protein